jgi:hypothetical protein
MGTIVQKAKPPDDALDKALTVTMAVASSKTARKRILTKRTDAGPGHLEQRQGQQRHLHQIHHKSTLSFKQVVSTSRDQINPVSGAALRLPPARAYTSVPSPNSTISYWIARLVYFSSPLRLRQ